MLRKIVASLIFACILASTLVGLVNAPKAPLLAWTSVAIAGAVMAIALATNLRPKRDAILFAVCALCSGVFMGASTVGFPGSLPMWLRTIGSMAIATLALVVDAEGLKASVNRL
jgi:hypothetical protein